MSSQEGSRTQTAHSANTPDHIQQALKSRYGHTEGVGRCGVVASLAVTRLRSLVQGCVGKYSIGERETD